MYKIKFLEAVVTDSVTGEVNKRTLIQYFSDGMEINGIAENFNSTGFLRVLSVEPQKGAKLSLKEVAEKFYPEGKINEKEMKVKKELLGDVLKKEAVEKEEAEKAEADKKAKETEQALRLKLRDDAKSLFEAKFIEKDAHKTITLDQLKELVNGGLKKVNAIAKEKGLEVAEGATLADIIKLIN